MAYAFLAVKILCHNVCKIKSGDKRNVVLKKNRKDDGTKPGLKMRRFRSSRHYRAKREDGIELENNLVKMMYVIVLSFVVYYIPYPILLVLFTYSRILECWKYVGIIGMYSLFVLQNLPYALHPLCYATKSKFFSRAFHGLLLCKSTRRKPVDTTKQSIALVVKHNGNKQ